MKILVAGDYVPVGRFYQCLSERNFDYSNIESVTKSTDFSILNFEAPIVNNRAKGINKNGPNLKVDRRSINALKKMGFNAVTLANNHFRDYGQKGVETTISELRNNNIDYVGGGHNIGDAQKTLFKEFEDGIVSIINICENEFSAATESRGGSMPLDIASIYRKIIEAKQKSDYVLVIVHGGHEGYQFPSPRMKKLYQLFVDFGADAVVNHHQHCYSGYEYYQNRPIVYGLGNFIFDWKGKRNGIWNEGYMVIINFERKEINIELIPYEQCNEKAGAYVLDDSQKVEFFKRIDSLNECISDNRKLQEEFDKFAKSKRGGVLATLSPYTNRYIMALISRGFLPSFIAKKKAAMLYNYINCESHRDITLYSLSGLFEDQER